MTAQGSVWRRLLSALADSTPAFYPSSDDQIRRQRLLSALADSSPAFTATSVNDGHTRRLRLLAALADSSPAFRASRNVDEYTSTPERHSGRTVGARPDPDAPIVSQTLQSISRDLSRRIRPLLNRQLVVLERLERDEEDPDVLDSYFRLDHLATMMQWQLDRLLALSDSPLPRQLNSPVPVRDMILAAVSEVEQYTRIEVHSAPAAGINGHAVSDLVHLIAELLNNATSFSEPNEKVIVRTAMTDKRNLAIQITDYGVGMSEEELNQTNAQLSDPPNLDVAMLGHVGLHVVARLARRHNIVIRLRANDDIAGGVVAVLTIPANLIVEVARETSRQAEPVAAPNPPRPFADTLQLDIQTDADLPNRPSAVPGVAARRVRPGERNPTAATEFDSEIEMLIAEFVRRTGIAHAVAISVDGEVIARSHGISSDIAERLLALAPGLNVLAKTTASVLEAGAVAQVVVELDGSYLLLMHSPGRDFHVVVLTPSGSNISAVTSEMRGLIKRIEQHLSSELRRASDRT